MFSTLSKIVVFGLLALSSGVLAAPSTPTSGEVSRRDYTPTRIAARHGGGGKPVPSQGGSSASKSPKKFGGAVIPLGFVSDSLSNSKGTYKLTAWKWECLQVVVPSTPGPFDLPIKDLNGSKRFLGLAGDNTKSSLSLVRTAQTGPGSQPQAVGNTGVGLPLSESAVWSISGGKLTATWKPQSGNTFSVPAYHWLANPENLYFVTNPAAFASNHFGAYEVTLELVSP
ncbi:hypothetical protein FA13DRAFT_98257 [Coprinellus micaceus]|uniref:Ubiquitin 3 binding protein But2 C-terminal domain-containing protein n=1 Tax=Coprinellus micaceus TaxID=71717 RepID=A0A4Y7SJA1_COPMI|nr:hypothetical protein FA13DRAFT_98257 [Coprinellus micaceus]